MRSVQEIRLERFQVTSMEDQRYLTIFCRSGSVWVTAGKGFDDIVLHAGRSISIIPDSKIVIEALSDSAVSVSCARTEELHEQAVN